MKINIITSLSMIILCIVMPVYMVINMKTDNEIFTDKEIIDSIQVKNTWIDTIDFMNKHPSEGLMDALLYYDVKHPEIVYAQAILETGHFKSDLCINDNNLFGLYNSRKKEYYTFNHWTESIVAYIDYIQYRYVPPNNYYEFLDNIGYAEDPYYTDKLKRIVNRNDKRGTSDSTNISDKAK